jgi:hypothetical protein
MLPESQEFGEPNEPDRVSLCAQAAFQASENQSHLL